MRRTNAKGIRGTASLCTCSPLSHPAKMHQATKKAAEAAFCPLTYCLRSRCRLAFGRRLARVFLLELLDAPCGIDDLLLTGIKRMAFSAHLNVNILAHR